MAKCEICGKEILRDSQCINYKYYHNNCIENLQQTINKAIDKLYTWGEVLDPKFQKEMLDILEERSK